MTVFDERIHKLQDKMKEDGVKAYIIPATDPHMSEECCSFFAAERFYFCPFKGSDGTLLVTQDHYYIYADGRYWVEAEGDLQGSECVLVYVGKAGVPSMREFIKANDLYPLGLDLSLCSNSELRSYYIDEEHIIKQVSYRWMVESLPVLPKGKIFRIDPSLLSTTVEERVNQIMDDVFDAGAKAVVIANLDDVAYVLGYRGSDIPCTPIFYSYLYIDENKTMHLFIDQNKLPDGFHIENLVVHSYEEFIPFLESVKDVKTLVDMPRTNARICTILKKKVNRPNPAYLHKAVKGQVEIENTKRIQAIDGVAVTKLMKYIDDHIDEGNLDEYSCAMYLDQCRRDREECFDLSFGTIAAADANAAMMHYAPTKEDHAPLTRANQLLLVDSGGQYFGGTTDTTRTFIVSKNVSDEVKHDYTLTLKSQIALSTSVFEKGCSGVAIDIKAREIMWKEGLDYKCGTGHGVGYISCVHEGPVGFRYRRVASRDDAGELQPGHVITIEPGVYKNYKYGIRLENNLVVVPAFETSDGIFYRFETITYAPYDRRGIDMSMLTKEEIDWVNEYNQTVVERLTPYVQDDPELFAYLKKQCEPLA